VVDCNPVEPDEKTDEASVCNLCQTAFKTRTIMLTHLREVHAKGRKFTCDFCKAQFKCKRYLRRHVRVVHASQKGVFTCELCPASYISKTDLSSHGRDFHATERTVHCESGPDVFKNMSYINERLRNVPVNCEVERYLSQDSLTTKTDSSSPVQDVQATDRTNPDPDVFKSMRFMYDSIGNFQANSELEHYKPTSGNFTRLIFSIVFTFTNRLLPTLVSPGV